jgi:hypothetical protein
LRPGPQFSDFGSKFSDVHSRSNFVWADFCRSGPLASGQPCSQVQARVGFTAAIVFMFWMWRRAEVGKQRPKKQNVPTESGRTFLQDQFYHTNTYCQVKSSSFQKYFLLQRFQSLSATFFSLRKFFVQAVFFLSWPFLVFFGALFIGSKRN